MKIEQNDYVLSDEELSVALGNLGQKPNALGIKSAAMFSERDKGNEIILGPLFHWNSNDLRAARSNCYFVIL